jgi:hypothetical protein
MRLKAQLIGGYGIFLKNLLSNNTDCAPTLRTESPFIFMFLEIQKKLVQIATRISVTTLTEDDLLDAISVTTLTEDDLLDAMSDLIAPSQLKLKFSGLSSRANYTDRPTNHRLSVKLVPTFEDGVFRVFSAADPYGRNLAFLDRSNYFFFQVTFQLHSRGRVDPVPDPQLLRKSCTAGNRTRASVL